MSTEPINSAAQLTKGMIEAKTAVSSHTETTLILGVEGIKAVVAEMGGARAVPTLEFIRKDGKDSLHFIAEGVQVDLVAGAKIDLGRVEMTIFNSETPGRLEAPENLIHVQKHEDQARGRLKGQGINTELDKAVKKLMVAQGLKQNEQLHVRYFIRQDQTLEVYLSGRR